MEELLKALRKLTLAGFAEGAVSGCVSPRICYPEQGKSVSRVDGSQLGAKEGMSYVTQTNTRKDIMRETGPGYQKMSCGEGKAQRGGKAGRQDSK